MNGKYKFETMAIHAGQEPDPATGAIIVPIYQTSTYVQDDIGKHKGYEYSRTSNPTRTACEKCIAALENGKHGLAFSSGMAAISTCMNLLRPLDHVITSYDIYGGTYRLFNDISARYNIKFDFVDITEIKNIERAFKDSTKMIWIESPTNPLLKLADIRAISQKARERGILTVVDNTFMTPYFQRPLELGADIVAHSATKYLGGHSDLICGAVVVSDSEIAQRLYFHQNAQGAIAGPFESWLVLRGLKTLACRMESHQKNAARIADFLESSSKIEKVYYPGLLSCPQHELAKNQMSGFGGMISFKVKGGFSEAHEILKKTRIFSLAESLGGVESLISHPDTMTHASIPKNIKESIGITENLIRLSVGIENVEDLLFDLEKALS